MSSTKVLWGQTCVVLGIVLLTMWAATQWVAWKLGFQPRLGPPWFEPISGMPIYPPPAFFWWWYAYDAYAPRIFLQGACIAASGGIISMIVAFAMSIWRAREAKTAATYGSAHWARVSEIRASQLLGQDGVVLGRFGGNYLRHNGPEHVLCFAPTRSGKGVGLVIPTLLTWPGSCVVHDIKGENWNLTSGFRARHGRVLLFDPTNRRSAAYNPLLEVRRGEWEVRDVQNIADVLVDPEGALERRNHWEKTSHSLLVGAILHVLYAEEDKTLAGVANFLSDPRRPIEATLNAMMTTAAIRHQPDQAADTPDPQPDRAALNGRSRCPKAPASAAIDAGRVSCPWKARLLRIGAGVYGGLWPEKLPDRPIPQPDRKGLRSKQLDPRQLPRPRLLRDQRREDGTPRFGCARNGNRTARHEELRRA